MVAMAPAVLRVALRGIHRLAVTGAALAVTAALVAIVPADASVAAAADPRCTIVGTSGPDRLVGGPGRDVICGRGGDDRLAGRGGDDVLRGGRGDDLLRGGSGDDRLGGGRGSDTLLGLDNERYVDLLSCGPGRDEAVADANDRVRRNCERVTQDPPPNDNEPPVAVDDTYSTPEDTSLDLTVTGPGGPAANDTDGDGDVLTISSVSDATGGTATIDAGSIRFTPAEDLCGDGAGGFDYAVSDGQGGSDVGHVTVDVTCVQDDPVALDDAATVRENAPATSIPVLSNDSDADGDPLTIASVTQPLNGAVVITGGGTGLTYRPHAGYCNRPGGGPHDTFTYTLAPGTSTATVSMTVTCVDNLPTATDDDVTLDEDSGATPVDVLANDTDPDGGPIWITSVTQPDHGTVVIVGGGTGLTYQPDPDYCNDPDPAPVDTFSYTLNAWSTATVSVTVTCVPDAPVVATGGTLTYTEGDPATPVAPGLTVTDADAGATITGGSVAFTANFAAAEDQLVFANQLGITGSYNAGTGVLTLTGTASPADYQTALRSVSYVNSSNAPSTQLRELTFTVTDDTGRDGSDTRDIEVVAVDDAPTAVDDSETVLEDAPATTIDVLTNDIDPDGGPMNVVSATDPADGTVVVALDGSDLTYEPDPNYCNNPPGLNLDTFDYTVNGGSTATVSVTVTCVDDFPVAVDDGETVVEDAPATTIDVLANDTDVDGGPISVVSATDPADGTVVVALDGSDLTYVPDPDYCNNPPGLNLDTFDYTLNGGSTATVTVTVTCVDDAPTVNTSAGATSYTENDPATAIDPGLTVSDPDSTTLTGATVEITGNAEAAEDVLAVTDQLGITGSFDAGTSVLTLTGNASVADYQTVLRDVTYRNTSDAPSTVTRTVTFTATDDTALDGSDTRDIAVTAANDPPTAVDDTGSTDEDTPLTVSAPGVLANDTDVDPGDTKTVVALNGSATLTGSSAEGGSVTINANGSYTYTPPAAFQGLSDGESDTDSFTYTMADGAGADSTATVTITVAGVSDAPIAAADSFDAVGNTGLFVGTTRPAGEAGKELTGSVLDNDTDPDTPQASLVAVAETKASTGGGTVTIQVDGNFSFQPDDGDTTDSFTYTVSDGDASTDGTVTLTMTGEVWYVKNNAAAGGDGTSDGPFDTLAEAETASGAGDTTFVFDGDGTTTGLDTGYQLDATGRLIGEVSGLSVGAFELYPATPGARPTLTASGEDVVALDDGNVVRGLQLDPSGAGGGIAGESGDTGGGTIEDLRIIDSGTAGDQPGLDLVATTGTFNVSDLEVDNSATTSRPSTAIGVRLSNAGIVNFAAAGTISIRTVGVKGLEASGPTTSLGTSVFDDITVTGSGTGGVSMVTTTGTTTFSNLALTTTTGATAAFLLTNAGTVTVPAGGTANVSATGGPAVDVTGTSGAVLAFDDVDSASSGSDGVNLAGLGAGTFTANSSSTISNAAAVSFDLDGGSGAVTYNGTITDDVGQLVRVANTNGGTKLFHGAITDGADGDGGGISLTSNGASTIVFDAGLTLSTGTNPAFAATDGGTVAVTDPNAVGTNPDNTITTTSGAALNIANTVIGAAGVNFRSISSNGAARGILLNTTGTSGRLVVTGNGGICTNADSTGCTGGTIQNGAGGDDSSATPIGSGIVLNNTLNPSFTRMLIHDHSNYGIRGTDVAGLTLANSVINGANGNNGTTPFDDSSVWFTNLTGSASVTETYVSGGFEDNFRVLNTTGSLNRITFTNDTFGVSGARPANDALLLETSSSASQMQATITGSTFSSAAGDLLQLNHNGSGAGDLVLTGSTFSNAHPAIATGGGGLSLFSNGTGGNTTMNISGNSFRDAVGPGVLIVKTTGAATQSGTFTSNTIGVSGVANSGSAEGSALKLQTAGQGTLGWTVTNNNIRGYNNFGIEVLAGGGASAQSGTINTTVTGNTIAEPGNTAGTIELPKNGIHYNIGTVPGDTFQACAVIGGAGGLANTINVSGADAVPPTGVDVDVRLRQRQSTTIRLPGYAGANNDNTAVQTFINGRNSAGTSTLAANTVPTGGGFTGTGTSCP